MCEPKSAPNQPKSAQVSPKSAPSQPKSGPSPEETGNQTPRRLVPPRRQVASHPAAMPRGVIITTSDVKNAPKPDPLPVMLRWPAATCGYPVKLSLPMCGIDGFGTGLKQAGFNVVPVNVYDTNPKLKPMLSLQYPAQALL